jgi:5-methylcytosine-specific restriction protein A
MPSRPKAHHPLGTATEARKAHDRYRGSARERGYTSEWDKISRAYRASHPLCEDCEAEGRLTPVDEVDHIIPLDKGGTNDDGNLRSLCKSHHQIKTRRENPR